MDDLAQAIGEAGDGEPRTGRAQGGDGGQPDVITMTPEELKKRQANSYQAGKRDADAKHTGRVFSILEELGIKPVEDDVEKTLRTIGEGLKNADTDTNEKVKLSSLKIEQLEKALAEEKKKTGEAYSTRDSYIIDNELMKELGSKVVKPSAALTLIRGLYEFKLGADGKTVEIMKGGERQVNRLGDLLKVSEAVEEFLKEESYLVKADGKTTNMERETVVNGKRSVDGQRQMSTKDYDALPFTEREKVLEKLKQGEIELV